MSWLSDRTGIHVNSINDVTSGRAIKEAIKNPLVDAALTGLIPGVGGAIAGLASKIPGVAGLAQGVGSAASGLNGILTQIPGVQGVENAVGSLGKSGLGQAIGNLASGAGSFLTGNGGANALGLAQGINAAQLQQKANQYATDALGGTQAAYNAKAPLRAQAIAQLPGAINANPFSRMATNNPNLPQPVSG